MESNLIEYDGEFNTSSVEKRPEESIRDFLLNSVTPRNTINLVYRSILHSLLILFNDLYYINSENEIIKVKCITGSPEKVIADINRKLNLVLPLISVTQVTTLPNQLRQRNESLIVQDKIWDDKKQRAIRVVGFAPRSVDIIYNINIWSKYRSVLDQLLARVYTEFNPGKVVQTKFNQYTKAFILIEEDNSLFTVGDGEDRILRKSFNIGVEAYIPQPQYTLTSTGKIEEFNTEIYVDDTTLDA